MKTCFLLPFAFAFLLRAEPPPRPALLTRMDDQIPVPLWADGAPGALGKEEKDIPTVTPYLPASGNVSGAAMVILPGGGYGGLAPHEGKGYADWLVTNGIGGFASGTVGGANTRRYHGLLVASLRPPLELSNAFSVL